MTKLMKHPIFSALVLLPLLAAATEHSSHTDAQSATFAKKGPVPLVEKIRAATARYWDVNVAIQEGFVPATPCVSGPSSGAMGVHFVLPARVGDGVLDANEPEFLIYEPLADGSLRLVGVEFLVLAADWDGLHPDGAQPAVDGQLAHFVGTPNRYRLPAFYELHVWAWRDNPNGTFADFNTLVSCDKRPIE